MRKLFTSLLLLGAFTVTHAQVTVTGYDATNSTVTINFTNNGARPTPKAVEDAIKAAFGDEPQGIQGSFANLKPHERKQQIKTVVLTGDWNNVDIDSKSYPGIGNLGNNSIAKIVEEFADNENKITLDLSQCEGFESHFVSVRDYYGAQSPRHANQTIPADGWSDGYTSDWLESDFTWTPTAQAGSSSTESFYKDVVINERHSLVTVSYDTNPVTVVDNPVNVVVDKVDVTYINNPVATSTGYTYHKDWEGGEEVNVNNPTNIPEGAELKYDNDRETYYIDFGTHQQYLFKVQTTSYTYSKNVDGLSDMVTVNNQDELTEVDGALRYISYEYDRDGNHITSKTSDGLTQNADGTWSKIFSTTYTYSTDPENSNNAGNQNDTNGLRQDSEGNWWYTRYLYQNQNGQDIVADNTNELMPNPDGEGWVFVKKTWYTYFNGDQDQRSESDYGLRRDGDNLYYDYITYDYTDENDEEHSDLNTNNLVEVEGVYKYKYDVTTVVDPICEFHMNKDLNVEGFIFPVSENFDFVPDDMFYQNSNIKRAVLGENIVAIGNHAFDEATNFEEVNFPSSLREMGHQAFKKTKISQALMAGTQLTRIRLESFEECKNLTEATFPPTLIEIQKAVFDQAALVDVDLSQCHELRMLAGNSFNQMKNWGTDSKPSLLYVKLCSHPKIIRGTSAENDGNSNGAFHEDTAIKTVEVVGCENTCVTECICENRAFEWDITHYQTAAPSEVYDLVAELIYPNNLPPCENSGYTSSFDYFEGDYKAGTMITQETLLCYYRQIAETGTGSGKFKWIDEETGQAREEMRTVTVDDRYIGNGWLEFIKTGSTTVVPKGEFLRTYSRTAGDGPCQLPKDIIAYRAVDYKSNAVGWVLDRNRKTGTHYLKEDATSDLTNDDNYVLITPDTDPSVYANRPLYSKVTTGGKLFLRPLFAKVARYPAGGEAQIEGYTDENMEAFDSEEIYSQLQNVSGGYSYVPEETGVVLYSRSLLEEAFLVLGGDFGTETVYKKFPHTGDRYEEGRLSSSNTDDDINMLQGSFGDGVPVAPVFPWVYKDKTNYSGGSYTSNKEYRNFAVVKVERNGGSVIEDRYRWKRLQPSKMKENRAFASIPVNRFDNWNESVDQMPDFTIDDEVETTGNNSNLMLISVFGDEEVNGETDGIEEIKTADKVVVNANDNVWYTTQGVRVANPTKGVYIHNGKKVVIK